MLNDDYSNDYMERSISAPPLAGYNPLEPLQDLLPGHLPTRSNPRVPKPVRSTHFEGSTETSRHASFMEGFSSLDILDNSHSDSIQSLVIDSKPKTPFDLIQADFPSTPSAVYSTDQFESTDTTSPDHHVDETDELDDVLTGIDQTTLAMQDLLSPEEERTSISNNSSSVGNVSYPVQQSQSAELTAYVQQQQQLSLLQQQQQQQSFQVQYPTPTGYSIYNPQQTQQVMTSAVTYQYPSSAAGYPTMTGGGVPVQMNSLPQSVNTDPNSISQGVYPMQTAAGQYAASIQQKGAYVPVDVGMGVASAGIDPATMQQQVNGYYIGNQLVVPAQQQQLYMDYYRQLGMTQNGTFPQMNFPQQEMGYTTADGVTYVAAYPQQQIAGYWPQNQSARMDPSQPQQSVMYNAMYTQADYQGMNPLTHQMMMGMNMMGMNNGAAIMTPHGIISGNQLGAYQQMSGNLAANATGQVYLHPGQNNRNGATMPITSMANPNAKQDHLQHQDHNGQPMRDQRRNPQGNSISGVPRNNMHNQTTNRNMNNTHNPAHGTPPVSRDLVVEEFRNTYGKTKQWEIKDLIGHVVAFCQDQHGSRFIQQRLEVATDSDKHIVFSEVYPNAHSLMTDVFGNYVIQKLFEFGSPEQCETLATLLTGQAVSLALQMYGCRVIQKALEYVQTPRLIELVSEFEGQQVLRCVHDQNGNHVIQKCIEVISRVAKESPPEMNEYLSSRIQFIIQSFHGRVKELSMHPYGCRVVQRILEHCTPPQKAPVLEELRKCCRELIQDQYGNYVIQHVMQHGWEADRTILINEVQSKLLEYSQHKFASNVVEKCIQFADKHDRDEMIWTIINVTFDLNNPVDAKTGQCVLENMVRDPYANYVVQKVIDVSNEAHRGAIIRYVRENIVQLRRYTYGKHIIVRLEKVSGEKF